MFIRGQSKISKLEKVFKREDHFWKNTLPRLIEKNPEKVKFTLMDQNKELSDLNGKARILFLKSQFRKIIQNVLPFNTLCIMHHFESINISRWVKLKEELAKPNPDLSKIKASPGSKERKVSSQFTKFFSTHGERIVTNLKRVKNQIHELVKIRNRIFKSAKTIDDIIESSEYSYDKIDHIAVKKKWDELKKNGVDLFKMWGISKKDPSKDYSSEIEMTEWEEEESNSEF